MRHSDKNILEIDSSDINEPDESESYDEQSEQAHGISDININTDNHRYQIDFHNSRDPQEDGRTVEVEQFNIMKGMVERGPSRGSEGHRLSTGAMFELRT